MVPTHMRVGTRALDIETIAEDCTVGVGDSQTGLRCVTKGEL